MQPPIGVAAWGPSTFALVATPVGANAIVTEPERFGSAAVRQCPISTAESAAAAAPRSK